MMCVRVHVYVKKTITQIDSIALKSCYTYLCDFTNGFKRFKIESQQTTKEVSGLGRGRLSMRWEAWEGHPEGL